MSIEANCPGCNRVLRVADQHAGRQARCPVCGTIYIVPGESAASAGQPVFAPEPQWSMKTPEGRVYGPVTEDQLQRWWSEGRVTADCELRCGQASWRPASERFGSVPVTPSGLHTPSYETPHRGILILVLGILGWALSCVPLGVVAWVMGNSDLWEMECGRMDQAGRGLTQAGRIMGMIQTLLCLLVVLGGVVVIVILGLLSA
jgi:hypothetical protein